MQRFVPHFAVIALAVVVSALLPAPEREAQPDAGEIARATGIRVLGATRGYATTGLWLRAGAAYDRGDLYETVSAYQLIRELQPRNPAVYSYLAWNQAYNISAQFPELERREEWVARGFETLHQGQDRLPHDAGLRLDEWHFLLNRSAGYPAAVLRVETKRLDDARWEHLCELALQTLADLIPAERASLEDFLENYGLHLDLFDSADAYAALPQAARDRLLDPALDQPTEYDQDFPAWERPRIRALFALPQGALAYLALAHWCRLHAMFLAILPAMDMRPHGLVIEQAVLNTARLAYDRIPPGVSAQEFQNQYRQAVELAFVASIENALRIGGVTAASEHLDNVRYNFRNQPELLPPEVIDTAYREIQE